MFLEQALVKKLGIPYEITGSDIDQNSVNIAKNGVYPIQEVNTIPQVYLTEHWRRGTGEIKDYAAVHPSLKAKAHFQTLNLLEMKAFNNTFDVIFCRNVFIYFTDADVKKVAMSLADRLKPGGFFASGISEPIRFQEWPLKSVGPSVYKKVIATPDVKEKTTAAVAAATNTQAPTLAPTYRVLCVDDSPVIQKLIEKVYGGDPMCSQVEFASNGEEARKMLDSKKFDLITLDIHMPVCGGIEFLERLYNLKNDPPVLMISSVNRTDIDLATKSISLGAFDYIEKPAMNKLAQSSAEILTKTQMALRSGKTARTAAVGATGFDKSIGQKIVVPDASQCARLVVANEQSLPQLEAIVRGQKAEYRSPALVIVHDNFSDLDKHILQFSPLSVTHYRGGKFTLHPNAIYLVDKTNVEHIVEAFIDKSVSMQVLHDCGIDFSAFKKCRRLQLLVDESASAKIKNIENSYGLKISDVTPATSFASLSLEYFAKLRKAAA